jgi:NAD(P)-dependent dehydrogenase (short-subunit alcohol dehydrogenase family)
MGMRLDGKVALITGGARGIGAETAKALAAKGVRVVITDVDTRALVEVAAQINEHAGDERAVAVAADVTNLAAMEAAARRAVETYGGIDIVLANAGIASYGSVAAVDPATFRRVIDINVTGVFHTVRAALPSVVERQGYILVVSSLAAFAAAPGLAAYNASKAGAEHFANALRLELAHEGVDVGCAHMSWIDTPLVQDAKEDLGAFRRMLDTLPYPLGRTTSVDKCVDAFVSGIAGRKRHVYVPGWVAGLAQARNVINSSLAARETLKHTPTLLPEMDAEVAALGRSTSARNVSNHNDA